MSIFDLAVEERLWYYVGMLHSGNGLWVWYFSERGDLYYTTCPYEKELKMFLFSGDCMDYALGQGKELRGPFMISDPIGMNWLGEYVEVKEKRLFLIGPVFHASSSVHYMEEALRKMDLSIQMKQSSMKVLSEVPVLNRKMMISYGRMLHYLITLEDARYAEIKVAYPKKPEETRNAEEEKEGNIDYDRMNNQEQLLLQCVRDGNRNYSEALDRISVAGTDRLTTGNPLRDAVNIVIIFTSKCAQAAIEGGLDPKVALEMERRYMSEAERKKDVTGLMELNMKMLEDFIDKVHEGKQNYGISRPINACCNYVKAHLTEELTLERIAKEIGYTEYYLTRKFYNEMGIKLLDYIKQARMEYAKIWLTTTNKSIQEISEELHLGARNYFSRIFKASTGMTPAAYRERVMKRNPERENEKEAEKEKPKIRKEL